MIASFFKIFYLEEPCIIQDPTGLAKHVRADAAMDIGGWVMASRPEEVMSGQGVLFVHQFGVLVVRGKSACIAVV